MKLSQQLHALKSSWGISHIKGDIKKKNSVCMTEQVCEMLHFI